MLQSVGIKDCSAQDRNFMSRNVSEVLARAKCYPQLLDAYFGCCCYGQDNHICVHCTRYNLMKTFDYSICQVYHFVVTMCLSVTNLLMCSTRKANNSLHLPAKIAASSSANLYMHLPSSFDSGLSFQAIWQILVPHNIYPTVCMVRLHSHQKSWQHEVRQS